MYGIGKVIMACDFQYARTIAPLKGTVSQDLLTFFWLSHAHHTPITHPLHTHHTPPTFFTKKILFLFFLVDNRIIFKMHHTSL